jgi:hypothetical protein
MRSAPTAATGLHASRIVPRDRGGLRRALCQEARDCAPSAAAHVRVLLPVSAVDDTDVQVFDDHRQAMVSAVRPALEALPPSVSGSGLGTDPLVADVVSRTVFVPLASLRCTGRAYANAFLTHALAFAIGVLVAARSVGSH